MSDGLTLWLFRCRFSTGRTVLMYPGRAVMICSCPVSRSLLGIGMCAMSGSIRLRVHWRRGRPWISSSPSTAESARSRHHHGIPVTPRPTFWRNCLHAIFESERDLGRVVQEPYPVSRGMTDCFMPRISTSLTVRLCCDASMTSTLTGPPLLMRCGSRGTPRKREILGPLKSGRRLTELRHALAHWDRPKGRDPPSDRPPQQV